MTWTRVLATGLFLLAIVGCGGARHQPKAFHVVGTSLPVEVDTNRKTAEVVSGTVYYRTPGRTPGHASGQSGYESVTMKVRGKQLFAMLPTSSLQAQDKVEYYIDVHHDGELHTMGSPGGPYVVTFLDQDDLVISSLRETLYATDASEEVRIVLHTWNQPIDQPRITYEIPGVPGEIVAAMESNSDNNYQVIIPARAVKPGTWRYSIEVPLNGDLHRLPQQGYRSFTVSRPNRDARDKVASGSGH